VPKNIPATLNVELFFQWRRQDVNLKQVGLGAGPKAVLPLLQLR